MESVQLAYKQDDYGNDLHASISWCQDNSNVPKPIVIVFHGGGLIVGSSAIIPKTQTEYLASQNFVVVSPNYRLAPQVTATTVFSDAVAAYDWATSILPDELHRTHGITIDSKRIAAMGHSSGGLLALYLASIRAIRAVTAFYPTLFISDPSTSAHKPTTAPPFGTFPDFQPTDEDWAAIKPASHQISEAALPKPGSPPQPRNKWQMHILKHGQWMASIQPDGNYVALDPLTRVDGKTWPPTMFVQGDKDDVPGSSLELVRRAENELKDAGVVKVEVVAVEGEAHMFDMPPMVGTSDLGPRWQAVKQGLEWLQQHI